MKVIVKIVASGGVGSGRTFTLQKFKKILEDLDFNVAPITTTDGLLSCVLGEIPSEELTATWQSSDEPRENDHGTALRNIQQHQGNRV